MSDYATQTFVDDFAIVKTIQKEKDRETDENKYHRIFNNSHEWINRTYSCKGLVDIGWRPGMYSELKCMICTDALMQIWQPIKGREALSKWSTVLNRTDHDSWKVDTSSLLYTPARMLHNFPCLEQLRKDTYADEIRIVRVKRIPSSVRMMTTEDGSIWQTKEAVGTLHTDFGFSFFLFFSCHTNAKWLHQEMPLHSDVMPLFCIQQKEKKRKKEWSSAPGAAQAQYKLHTRPWRVYSLYAARCGDQYTWVLYLVWNTKNGIYVALLNTIYAGCM